MTDKELRQAVLDELSYEPSVNATTLISRRIRSLPPGHSVVLIDAGHAVIRTKPDSGTR